MSQCIASRVLGGTFRAIAVNLVATSGLLYRSSSHPHYSYSTLSRMMIRHSLVLIYYLSIFHSSRSLQFATVIFFVIRLHYIVYGDLSCDQVRFFFEILKIPSWWSASTCTPRLRALCCLVLESDTWYIV